MKQFLRFLLAVAFIATLGLWLSTASFWHSVDALPEETPVAAPSITIDVTPKTKLVVDRILVTQLAKSSWLRVRCRWVGDNLFENYNVRPSLDGIDHQESKEGDVWSSAITKSPNDERPGFPFSLDIKNPPAEFESLPFKITLKQRKDKWWVDVPRLSPIHFSIDHHDVEISPIFQMRMILEVPTEDSEPMVVATSKEATYKPQTFHVKKTVLLDQTALQSAFTSIDKSTGEPRINIVFTNKGKELFAAVTRDCIHKELAVVIAGQLYSLLNILEPITGGSVVIGGSFNEQEARSLVARIEESLVKPK